MDFSSQLIDDSFIESSVMDYSSIADGSINETHQHRMASHGLAHELKCMVNDLDHKRSYIGASSRTTTVSVSALGCLDIGHQDLDIENELALQYSD